MSSRRSINTAQAALLATLETTLTRQALTDAIHKATGALGDAISDGINAGLDVELLTYSWQGRTYPAVIVRQEIEPSEPDMEDES